MQGEIYTEQAFGTRGELTESHDKLMNEQPEYYVFNGAAEALDRRQGAQGQGRRNGADLLRCGRTEQDIELPCDRRDFRQGLQSCLADEQPLSDVQTITVPPGGAAVVDMKLEVPGEYVLVDHALSRAARGLVGKLVVDGPARPDLFRDGINEQLGFLSK